MMDFWTMKDMVKHSERFSQDMIYDSVDVHTIRTCEVYDRSNHARIIYRGDGANIALIYADIFFTGTRYTSMDDIPDRVFIKNAKLYDLKNHFIER